MLRDMTRDDWLSWLELEPGLVPQALILRGTRNLRGHFAAHQAHFDDVVEVGSPNGLFEDIFIGRRGGTRVGYASVYGAPMASEVAHLFGVLGTRLVIQTGCCGGLADDLQTGDLLLATEAHCGEGAAQYYRDAKAVASVRASIPVDRWRSLPAAEGAKFRVGSIFTTAALLAEGDVELASWHAAGFAAVDMETAATFAVAEHFGMDSASILFVFDNPRRKDHILLTDEDKHRCRQQANSVMIDLTLAMIERYACAAGLSTLQVVSNPADPNDVANSTTPLASSTYSPDAIGRLTSVSTDIAGGNSPISYGWQYDLLNRVIDTTSSIDASRTYGYDDTNQLLSVSGGASESFTYDSNGNRLSTDGTVNQPGGGDRLDNDGTYSYIYDAEGNLTQRTTIANGDTRVFTYDYRNRLIEVTDHTGSPTGTVTQDVSYTYDTFNRRVSRTVDSDGNGQADEIEKYIYDGDHVIFDFVDPDGVGASPMALKHRYLYGPAVDQILAQEDADATPISADRVLWFLGDDQNTTHDLIDNTGTPVTGGHYLYGSYGTVINTPTADTSLTRYLYTGRELDTATDMQYNQERWYDSGTGRWISEDPIRFAAGDMNLYRYVVTAR